MSILHTSLLFFFFKRRNKLNIFLLYQTLGASFSCSSLVFFQILSVSFLKCLKLGAVLHSLCSALKNNCLPHLTHLEIHSRFSRSQKTAPCTQITSYYPRSFLQCYCLASYPPFYIAYTVPFVNTAWVCLISHGWISGNFCNLL